MTTLREAAQQALEALYEETAWFGPTPKGAAAITALKAALAEPDEFIEDETIYCPTCGEEDGGTTCGMPDCGLRCGAEPVQEPVAYRYRVPVEDDHWVWNYGTWFEPVKGVELLYAAPPPAPSRAGAAGLRPLQQPALRSSQVPSVREGHEAGAGAGLGLP